MTKKFKVSKDVSQEPSLVIFDQIMLTPGIWNGIKMTKDQIEFGIANTDWTNPENFALIDYHPQQGEVPRSTSWQGYFENIKYQTLEDGVEKEGMYGDLYIYDTILASKILSKKSPLAVSIDATYSPSKFGASQLSFTHTAVVYRPGCSDAYIQLQAKGDTHKVRVICEEDVSVKESKEDIKSVQLNFDLETDKLVQVFSKENELLFEGSVLSFRKEDDNTFVSIINESDEIKEFSVNDFLFFPIMPRPTMLKKGDTDYEEDKKMRDDGEGYEYNGAHRHDDNNPLGDHTHQRLEERINRLENIIILLEEVGLKKVASKKEELQLSNINTVIREDKKSKMNSKDIESLDARISLIEKNFEQLNAKLSENTEETEEAKPEEESTSSESTESTEEVKEEGKLESSETKEESTESKEEVVSEKPKVEKQEVTEESSESTEEVDEKPIVQEKVQEEAIEQLKSEVSKIRTELSKINEAKEEVQLKDEKKVAQSKTAVQLEGEEPKTEEKVQLSKMESVLARLNQKNV